MSWKPCRLPLPNSCVWRRLATMTTSTEPTGTRGAIPLDTFANRLMLARKHRGFHTIQEAAAKCGLDRQSWSNWERGIRPRDLLDVAERISAGLDIDPDWLLYGGPLASSDRSTRLRERLAARPMRPTVGRETSTVRATPNRRPRAAKSATCPTRNGLVRPTLIPRPGTPANRRTAGRYGPLHPWSPLRHMREDAA